MHFFTVIKSFSWVRKCKGIQDEKEQKLYTRPFWKRNPPILVKKMFQYDPKIRTREQKLLLFAFFAIFGEFSLLWIGTPKKIQAEKTTNLKCFCKKKN